MSIEEISRIRRKWVEANRENNFEEGIKKLLTDLYPDNAHFIYELLQNAEDPGATIVRFTLSDDSLEFEHNGSRLFNFEDVRSITSIGASTKRNDPTKIGKFGVGFKAVFAYTNTPEIQSGDFLFRITDMVVPESIDSPDRKAPARETLFRFPFDHPVKKKQQARREIESALLALGDNTLLFLSHIHTIEYLLPSGRLGRLQRVEKGDGRIEIQSIRPDGTETKSHWLRFDKDVDVTDDDGEEKRCRIAIAYALATKEGKKAADAEWTITPLERGQVSIYFPAEKEASSLRFHIHAPFASTVARDSVRESQANDRLLDQIALLVVESLHSIREQGMLTVSFLSVLPNSQDRLSEFYEPIRNRIVEAFKSQDLTPTKKGSHAPATGLYRGPSKISDVLDDDDLSFLTDYDPPLWAANPPQTNQREDRFLDSLQIDAWGWDELGDMFRRPVGDKAIAIEEWLAEKDDRWMMRFYSLLGEARESYSKYFFCEKLRLVRSESLDGDAVNVTPDEAYFAPPDGAAKTPGVHFVKLSVLESGRSELQKRLAQSFLEHVGVNPFDEKALLQLRLSEYEAANVESDSEHIKDIRQFLQHWNRDTSVQDLFDKVPFLLGRDNNNGNVWVTPHDLCVDEPYLQSGLGAHRDIHGLLPLAEVYFEKLPKSSRDQFIAFLKAIGVTFELAVIRKNTWDNPARASLRADYYRAGARLTNTVIDSDFTIEGLAEYIETNSITASRLIWNALTKAARDTATARYRPNQQYAIREAPSQLVHHLQSASWIPGKNGEFCSPKDMVAGELRSDFPYDDRNGLLTAIGFGQNDRLRSAAYQASNQSARNLGFSSVDEATEIAALLRESGMTPAEIRLRVAASDAISLPEKSVPNPERRRRGVLEHNEGTPDRESVKRERSVIVGASEELAKAKAYLRPMYTNVVGQVVCQCCRLEMPFKVNGLHYFEAVKLVGNLGQHIFQCRLALCPTCAAMYQHARETDDEELVDRLASHCAADEAASAEVEVALAGKVYKLWLVGTHIFDVRTLLGSSSTRI